MFKAFKHFISWEQKAHYNLHLSCRTMRRFVPFHPPLKKTIFCLHSWCSILLSKSLFGITLVTIYLQLSQHMKISFPLRSKSQEKLVDKHEAYLNSDFQMLPFVFRHSDTSLGALGANMHLTVN